MTSTTPQTIPSYLVPTTFNRFIATIAVTLSLILAGLLFYLAFHWTAIIETASFGSQLKLVLEFSLLIACTAASWKHAAT